MSPINLGILASGRGSNFQAILDHIELGILKDVEAKILIVDNPEARAIKIAKRYDVAHTMIRVDSKSEEKFEEKAHRTLQERGVDLVVLAGFMRIIDPYLIKKYRQRIMNIHPSLLPSFKGLNAQKQALKYGAKISGCTVHYASEKVDAGPIILQQPVPVKEKDTVQKLADRILLFEHRIYSKAIQLHADGRIHVEDNRTVIDYEGDWENNWNKRQKKFIEQQRKGQKIQNLNSS